MAVLPVDVLRPLEAASPTSDEAVLDRTWWGQYCRSLTRMSPAAREALDDDARWVADRAFPLKDGSFDVGKWAEGSRLRTGIVVGSVQSGKTSHMLGVAALALDRGVDILIVLAGTRLALWIQTYERLLHQLDGSTPEDSWQRDTERVLVPQPYDLLQGERADPRRYTEGSRYSVEKALSEQRPLMLIIPKEDDHLRIVSRFLASVLPKESLDARQKPLSMLILDDEADDASILDAQDGSKITPQLIAALWSGRVGSVDTRHPSLYATYVAYTATPQANYLQHTHNPLAPRDFHAALRVPLDRGTLAPRALSFQEPSGIQSYYCGGDVFYEWLRGLPGDPCIERDFPERRTDVGDAAFAASVVRARRVILADALRAYLVAGAVRLVHQRKCLSILGEQPLDLADLKALLPQPHTMLYHPSALRDEHFNGAGEVALWSGLTSDLEFLDAPAQPELSRLDPQGLTTRLAKEEPLWRWWLDEYQASISALSPWPGTAYQSPLSVSWGDVKDALITEVFPFTKLRVLNSDARADERPEFGPVSARGSGGKFLPPPDVYSIFVAGNVLSRGLTVEGLCTSVFVRSASEPAADTQMQMQRWFGYRGSHLPYCRLFTFSDQLSLFRAYHQNDLALKQEILSGMASGRLPFADGVQVLAGERFRATSKVESSKAPLHPGPTPSVRLVETAHSPSLDTSIKAVQSQLGTGNWMPIDVAGTRRGFIREEPLSLLDVAEFVEGLRYTLHDPDPAHPLNQRWLHLQELLRLNQPLFRAPGITPGAPVVDPGGCPFSIGAYLRLWDACLQASQAPGLYPTDAPGTPWSMIDHSSYRAARPTFYIAVRFGSAGPATDPRLRVAGTPILTMERPLSSSRGYLLETLWGTRGVGGAYHGDQLLDYHFHKSQPVPDLHEDDPWRQRGHPGLVLVHVVRLATGVDTIALGLALPHGGPDHIAALRGRRSRA